MKAELAKAELAKAELAKAEFNLANWPNFRSGYSSGCSSQLTVHLLTVFFQNETETRYTLVPYRGGACN